MNQAFDVALYDAVQRWARQIRATSGWTVETILATGEKLLAARQDLEPHGPKARAMLAAETRLSRPAMSRLEAIGRHAAMLRRRTATLPPHVSSLYALTRLPFDQFEKAIETDLRGISRSAIARLFGASPRPGSRRNFVTIAMPAGIAEETRLKVMAALGAAVALVGERHRIGLAISPRTAISRRPANS